MKIKILKNSTCTIYAALLHNLSTFPAQFVQIFALFFQKFQTKSLTFNALCNEKLFFSCTNHATINPISSDNQPYSTCTISSFTCTIYAVTIHNTLIFKKLKYVQIMQSILTASKSNRRDAMHCVSQFYCHAEPVEALPVGRQGSTASRRQ
jgi:hypothetical protein